MSSGFIFILFISRLRKQFCLQCIFWTKAHLGNGPTDPYQLFLPHPVLHVCAQLLSCVQLCVTLWTASSVAPFSSCPQSFPASGSFLMSQLFTSGGQSTGTSASASVLPMNVQGWFPLGWTGLILQSKKLSRVFSSTTVWKQCRVCRSKTTDADSLTTFLPVELHSVFSVNIPCFYLVPIIVGIWNQIYVKCYWWPLTGQVQSVFLRF